MLCVHFESFYRLTVHHSSSVTLFPWLSPFFILLKNVWEFRRQGCSSVDILHPFVEVSRSRGDAGAASLSLKIQAFKVKRSRSREYRLKYRRYWEVKIVHEEIKGTSSFSFCSPIYYHTHTCSRAHTHTHTLSRLFFQHPYSFYCKKIPGFHQCSTPFANMLFILDKSLKSSTVSSSLKFSFKAATPSRVICHIF